MRSSASPDAFATADLITKKTHLLAGLLGKVPRMLEGMVCGTYTHTHTPVAQSSFRHSARKLTKKKGRKRRGNVGDNRRRCFLPHTFEGMSSRIRTYRVLTGGHVLCSAAAISAGLTRADHIEEVVRLSVDPMDGMINCKSLRTSDTRGACC